jgi:hypothetical protein
MSPPEYDLTLRPGTGPFGAAVPGPVTPPEEVGSGQTSNPGAAALERSRRLRKQWGRDSDERLALLGLVLAGLEDVPLEEAARLLDIRPVRLLKLMHGEEQIPASKVDRLEGLLETLGNLRAVLRPSATGRWFRTEMAELGGKTPLDFIEGGGLEHVREFTKKYRDSSFS